MSDNCESKQILDFINKQPEFWIFYMLSSLMGQDMEVKNHILQGDEMDALYKISARLSKVMNDRYVQQYNIEEKKE